MLFRLSRGSGIGGLAGMAARTTRDGVTLARPLLGLSKAELIAYCEAEGVDFVRDASNEDPRFARTRMRALAEDARRRRSRRPRPRPPRAPRGAGRGGAGAADACGRGASASDRIRRLRCGEAACEPVEIVQRLLTLAIARVGRRDASRIGLEKIETLTAGLHEAWLARERFSANVAGAHVSCDAKGVLRVEREPARGKAGDCEGVVIVSDGAPYFMHNSL